MMEHILMHGLVSDTAPMCMVTKPYDGEYGVTLNKCMCSAGNNILSYNILVRCRCIVNIADLPMITLASYITNYKL